jgi:hypothetical protein
MSLTTKEKILALTCRIEAAAFTLSNPINWCWGKTKIFKKEKKIWIPSSTELKSPDIIAAEIYNFIKELMNELNLRK